MQLQEVDVVTPQPLQRLPRSTQDILRREILSQRATETGHQLARRGESKPTQHRSHKRLYAVDDVSPSRACVANLRCDEDLFAFAAKGLAEQPLALSLAVQVSSVVEGNARIECFREQRQRLGLTRSLKHATEASATETN